MSEEITVNIKSSADTGRVTVTVKAEDTVRQLKEKIQAQMEIPADQQRLIYSGKILKDADLLSVYKLATGHTIHLVRGSAGGSASATPTASSAVSPTATVPRTAPLPAATPAPPVATPNMNNLAGMFGGMGAMGGTGQQQQQQNPFGGMMQAMLSNPQLMEQMMASNPMMSQMGMTPEQIRQTTQDPMFQAMLSNPQLLASVMQMAGGIQGAQMAPNAGVGNQPGQTNSTASGLPPLGMPMMDANMLQQLMGGMGGGMPVQTPATPQQPPEVRWATQLQQLQDMGFFDPTENIRALTATAGNVNAAVEWLLRQM
eukprot:Partr_v1_DN24839_c0_g1_i1_m29750 putative ubiquilin 3